MMIQFGNCTEFSCGSFLYFCYFHVSYIVQEEDLLLVQGKYLLLVQEEDLLLVQEEDLLLVQEEDIFLAQEEDLLLVQYMKHENNKNTKKIRKKILCSFQIESS